jgi:hypothetical protein
MNAAPKLVAYSALTILLALYVVGIVSHGVVRHIVQTLPLWFPILLGLRRRDIAKWASLPCFLIWLALILSKPLILSGASSNSWWVNHLIVVGAFVVIMQSFGQLLNTTVLALIVYVAAFRAQSSDQVFIGSSALFIAHNV